MKQSENIANLAKALIIAHKAIDSSVVKNSTNVAFASGYADLGAVIEAAKEHMNNAGIVIIQSPTLPDHQGNVSLTTRLIHETGEWMEDTCSTPMSFPDPQGFGSAVSYLRRYAFASMMCLYQADDDGAQATGTRKGAAAAKPGAATPATPSVSVAAIVPASAAPSKSGTARAAPIATDENGGDELSPAIKKRVDAWLMTIKNASLERLETSRASAKTTFSDKAFTIVDKAFDERISALRAGNTELA